MYLRTGSLLYRDNQEHNLTQLDTITSEVTYNLTMSTDEVIQDRTMNVGINSPI